MSSYGYQRTGLVQDVVTAVVVLVMASPLLALPLAAAWRLWRWVVGL